MPFHSITYHDQYRFATLHNYGCTFKCQVCSYRLRSGPRGAPGRTFPKPEKFLSTEAIKKTLGSVPIETVYFMGGEPTIARELPEILAFAKLKLNLRTYLGHTNGSRLPMDHLDGGNVGIKAWDEKVHLEYTGQPKSLIFDNFRCGLDAGLELKANVVYIPGYVDADQVEAIAAWLASLNREIPFHIMGYIPIPGQPYPRPTAEQMEHVRQLCLKHLPKVNYSNLSSAQALSLEARDDRFRVRRIA